MSKLAVVRQFLFMLLGVVAWISAVDSPCQASLPAAQDSNSGEFRLDRFLVQPRPGMRSALETLNREQGVRVLHEFTRSGGALLLTVPEGEALSSLLARYRASGLVRYAERDLIVHAACFPNDPQFLDGSQWALWNYGQLGGKGDADIDGLEAWSARVSCTNVIVAIVDSGVRDTHEDLRSNLWVNPWNGTHGTNAAEGTSEPWDDFGHGTQMAGIIGAVGDNGKGVAGVAWHAQIMACRFLDGFGQGTISDAIQCIEFARASGAKVINLSWGLADPTHQYEGDINTLSNSMYEAESEGVVFVAAAGNASPGFPALDTDVTPFYPASIQVDNVLSVASTTRADDLAMTSDYGATNVDLAAPGNGILSTYIGADDSYSQAIGTSAASAFVAGALALVMTDPSLDYADAMSRVLSTVDPLPALTGKCVTGGRLNLRRALEVPAGERPTVQFFRGNSNLTVRVTGTPCSGYVLEVSTNLVDWTGIVTNVTSDIGEIEHIPVTDWDTRQFYRAYSVP